MRTVLFPVLISLATPHAAFAGEKAATAAVQIISEYADRICGVMPVNGETSNLTLDGETEAKLNGLVSKLADLGIKGTAKYEFKNFKNVLQADLPKLIEKQVECKSAVSDKMSGAILDAFKVDDNDIKQSTGNITNNGDGNFNNTGIQNKIEIK
ncbi:hypothetical protein [Neorhizobium sp. LjRoot104]|uniref:hypothetical protein n=1 Tax=Neorhizobium sp. LjRoot104 TaxID=3342254 RepID=UPI003ED0B896